MITIHNIQLNDLEYIRAFIEKFNFLEVHSLYTYRIFAYHFNDFCFVAKEEQNEIIGLFLLLIVKDIGIQFFCFKLNWYSTKISIYRDAEKIIIPKLC